MAKRLIFALILLLATPLFASQFTTNYNLEIPAIGDRNWQPIISKDIISMDTITGIISSDVSIGQQFITIISNDSATQDIKIQIISTDSATQDVKIQIISNDTITQDLKVTIISSDVATLKFVSPIISSDVGALKSSTSYPLSVANGGTGSAIGYTTVSNDVGVLKTKVSIISSDAVNQFVKGWASVTVSGGTPTLQDSYNVSGITDTGSGQLTVTWDTDFASTNYAVNSTVLKAASNSMYSNIISIATGSCVVASWDEGAGYTDPSAYYVIATGGQ